MKIIVAAVFCVLQCFSTVLSDGNYELKQVIVVARHGDRKPVYYPNDPYNNYWKNIPQTKLTKNGIKRSYKVGEELRRAYKSFLPSERNEVFVKSQDSDVCLETAETILAALFPPQGSNVWNPDLLWQPFAIHTQPIMSDNALGVFARCPAIEEAQNKVLQSKQVTKFIESEANFLKFVSEKSGLLIDNLIAANALFDTLSTEKEGGFKLPNWVTDEVFDELKKFSDLFNTISSTPIEVKRLRGGPLLELITNRLNIVNRVYLAPFMKKFSMFSTQGQIIATLLNTLNVSNQLAPPMSAVLLFELHKNKESNQYSVKISYFNETSIDERHTLYLPECYGQEMCPLNLFVEIAQKMIPSDWQQECQLETKSKNDNKKKAPGVPGFPLIPGLQNIPTLPNLPKIPGQSQSKGKKSKSKNPSLPFFPQKPTLKAESEKLNTASKGILVIPILGYVLLGAVVLTLIYGLIYFLIKTNRRSLYEIV